MEIRDDKKGCIINFWGVVSSCYKKFYFIKDPQQRSNSFAGLSRIIQEFFEYLIDGTYQKKIVYPDYVENDSEDDSSSSVSFDNNTFGNLPDYDEKKDQEYDTAFRTKSDNDEISFDDIAGFVGISNTGLQESIFQKDENYIENINLEDVGGGLSMSSKNQEFVQENCRNNNDIIIVQNDNIIGEIRNDFYVGSVNSSSSEDSWDWDMEEIAGRDPKKEQFNSLRYLRSHFSKHSKLYFGLAIMTLLIYGGKIYYANYMRPRQTN